MKSPFDSSLFGVRAWSNLAAALTIVIASLTNGALAKPQKSEIRAAWLPFEGLFDKDKVKGSAEVRACVDRLAHANFNSLFVWVTSEYAAALHSDRYRAGHPLSDWDAVGVAIREAAKRGLQTHVWYSFTYYKSTQSPEFDPKEEGDPAWISIAKEIHADRSADCCPLHPAAREWELKLIQQIVARYPTLAGVHIEEPGYGFPDRCICDVCRDTFTRLYGAPIEREIDGARAAELKCLGTTEFMRVLDEWRRQPGRKLQLSTTGGANWRYERTLGRDWAKWAKLGWLDFYAAQVYTSDPADFSHQAMDVIKDLKGSCPVLIGIGAKWSGGANNTASIVRQIELARQAGANGVAIYHGGVLSDECLAALKEGPFRDLASAKPRP
jgi:uncharacterized lipoprotein YddW (UPF0748 family)